MRDEALKHAADAGAAAITVGTILGYLPAMAAIVTIIWTAIRIYETETVRNLLQKLRGRR